MIAESFGDIFYSNCFQNGLLPIRLPDSVVQSLVREATELAEQFTVDLLNSSIATPSGNVVKFAIDPLRREGLLAGLDDIGLTLSHETAIVEWQNNDRSEHPWVWNTRGAAVA